MSSSPVTLHTSAAAAAAEAPTDQGAGACGCGGCGCGGEGAAEGRGAPAAAAPGELDVRSIAHDQRHARVLARVGALEPGESFVLAAGHDPLPLRRELEAHEPGQVTWEYVEQGPEVWRVRVGRVAGHCC